MTPEMFRDMLIRRQEKPYEKQNEYYAWKKPDGTLFMIGMESYQMYHILKYEYNDFFKDYGAVFYSIDPHASHMRGPQEYDPLEELVSKISDYEYVGAWRDPDMFMDIGNGPVAACGRWELAKKHILNEPNKGSLDLFIEGIEASIKSGPYSFMPIAGEGRLQESPDLER